MLALLIRLKHSLLKGRQAVTNFGLHDVHE